MSDDLFPSGMWTGFYNYTRPADKHRMDMCLSFSGGALSGDGNDDVGLFLIGGSYDSTNRECEWVKHYIGRHAVFYRGFREGKGIWGTWVIPDVRAHGGFHIWPLQSGSGEEYSGTDEKETPKEAVEPQAQPIRN